MNGIFTVRNGWITSNPIGWLIVHVVMAMLLSRWRTLAGWPALCALLALSGLVHGYQGPSPLGEWEYRWGDSPLGSEGEPLWLSEPSRDWQAIAFPSNPPEREGRQYVWFRTVLPEGNWRDPVIHITSINLVGQVFLGDELIYEHGDMQQPRFIGWPWHLIPLPDDFAGQTLSIRIYSDYTSIGLWGDVRVMDRLGALKAMLKASAKDLAVSAFSLLLATLAGIFALMGPDRRGFGATALFACASGLMLLAETPARQLIADAPLAWDMLRAASYFTLPIAMGLLLSHWLVGSAKRWMARFWQLHLGYLVVTMGLVQFGFLNLALTFPVFDVLLLLTLPCMLLITLVAWRRLALEQRLLVFSFVMFAPLLVLDMLVAHGLVALRQVPLSVGALGFSMAIVGVSLWHYRFTQRQLALANLTLEAQVKSRTAELDQLVDQLKGLSLQDALTGLPNRRHFDTLLDEEMERAAQSGQPLCLLMIDIDHFKNVNDSFGHDVGDAVLIEVANLLTRCFRGSDVVCRLGGEEFVALLPMTDLDEAERRANELLQTLRTHALFHLQQPLGYITLSCGIAAYPEHADSRHSLIKMADQALYQAKNRGRDRCVIWQQTEADQSFIDAF